MTPTSRTALITGANKGIGLAIVRNLALQYPSSKISQNGTLPLLIYLTARDQGRGEAAVKALQDDAQLKKARALAKDGGLSTIKYRGLDISRKESIDELGRFLKEQYPEGIDVVVNNAGIAMDGFDHNVVTNTLQTNYYGTLHATYTLLPLLRPRSGRLINVASMAGTLNQKYSPSLRSAFAATSTVAEVTALMDAFSAAVAAGTHTKDGWPSAAYAVSKTGVIGVTRAIAKEENGNGVLINSCCPGYVNTDMTKGKGQKSVDEGARTPVMLAVGEVGGVTGEFWSGDRVVKW